jgi:hypothetical protein
MCVLGGDDDAHATQSGDERQEGSEFGSPDDDVHDHLTLAAKLRVDDDGF